MSGKHTCRTCGGELAGGAAAPGFCPRCLLQAAGGQPDESRPEPPPASGFPEPTQRKFGGYDLLEEIGRGGMGVVYKARQRNLDRLVAIKMLAAGAQASPEFIQRLHSEASAAACLQHPRIVAIHEVGVQEGQHYFAMDYIAGQSLARLAGGHPLPARAAVRYVQLIAEAVHYAHDHGILHRDLKPSNVLIDLDDQPHITDFGLARRLEGRSELTVTGQVLGSPPYMAPEQVQGKKGWFSRRTDVYGLGAMLFHLLTGRPPFVAAELAEVVKLVMYNEPLSPRELNGSVPRDLETICLKCLEKDPLRRYATAKELADELSRFLNHEPIRTRPLGASGKVWRWCLRKPALATAITVCLLLLTVGITAISILWQRADRAFQDASLNRRTAEMRLARMQVSEGWRRYEEGDWFAALSLFTEAFGLEKDDPQRAAIHQLRLNWLFESCPKPLQAWDLGGRVNHVDISSNGRFMAVALTLNEGGTGAPSSTNPPDPAKPTSGAVQVWNILTCEPVTPLIPHAAAVTYVSFDTEARQLAAACADGTVHCWEVATAQPVHPPLRSPVPGPLGFARFSPDGQRLVASNAPETTLQNGVLMMWTLESRQCLWTNITPGMRLRTVSFSPDGTQVLAGSQSYLGMRFDAATGTHIGSITNCWDLRGADYSAARKLVALSGRFGPGGRTNAVVLYDTETWCPVAPALTHQASGNMACFSPDGTKVATGSSDCIARVWEVGTGQALTPPLEHHGSITSLAFCPHGDCVATGSADATARVWEAATGQPLTPPLPQGSRILKVAFTGRGENLLTVGESGLSMIWSLRPGGLARNILPHQPAPVFPAAGSFHPNTFMIHDPGAYLVSFWHLDEMGRVVRLNSCLVDSPVQERQGTILSAYRFSLRRLDLKGMPLQPPLPMGASFLEADPEGGRVLVEAREPLRIQLRDSVTGEVVWEQVFGGGMSLGRFSPDGMNLLAFSPNAGPHLLHSGRQQLLRLPTDSNAQCFDAAFSPNGSLLALAADNGSVWVYRSQQGRELTPPFRHSAEVWRVSFSPDGQRVLTASGDRTARIWSLTSGAPDLATITHRDAVLSAEFSQTGDLVVTGCADRSARVWDAATGEPVTPPLVHEDAVGVVRFCANGAWLMTIAKGASARLWRIPGGSRAYEDWVRLSALLRQATQERSARSFVAEWSPLRARFPSEFAVTPTDLEVWHQHEAWKSLARADWEDVIAHWTRALEVRPNAWEHQWCRGRAYLELARASGAGAVAHARSAVSDFLAVLRQQPGHLEGWRDLSRALELVPEPERLAQEIVPMLREVEGSLTNEPDAVVPLALVLYRLNQFPAVVDMLLPLTASPTYYGSRKEIRGLQSQVWSILSMAEYRLGSRERAIGLYQHVDLGHYLAEDERLRQEARKTLGL